MARTAEVTASLQAFCEQTANESADFDELMMVGLLLQENPNRCAETILEWLAADVTPRVSMRLVPSSLAFGAKAPASPPPAIDVVAQLAALRPAQRTDPDAEYSYALAMSRIAASEASSAEAAILARRELDVAARRGTGDPSLDKSLFALRERLLPRSARTGGTFRAYAVTGKGPVLFVVEDSRTGDEIAEVIEVHEAGSLLTIRYRKLTEPLSNIVAVDAVDAGLFTSLLEKQHGDRISSVDYIDEVAHFRVTADYPK